MKQIQSFYFLSCMMMIFIEQLKFDKIMLTFKNITWIIGRSWIRKPWIRNMRYCFCDNKYRKKTSKEIEQEILAQKWKTMQDKYRSLSTGFGLKPPTHPFPTSYSSPSVYEYTLETLRECSKDHPVYLWNQLQNSRSPFHRIIQNSIQNLWRADKKEGLEFLEFLYVWKYKEVNILELYERCIRKWDLEMEDLWNLWKLLEEDESIQQSLENKVLGKIKDGIHISQYGPLLKILNMLTVKDTLSETFYISVTESITKNLNQIPLPEVVHVYIYYTYHILQNQIMSDILELIQERIFTNLRFFNAEQTIAIFHTFLKNTFIGEKQEKQKRIKQLVNRVQLMFISEELSFLEKKNVLKLSYQLPEQHGQLILAHAQRELLKKKEKFDYQVLTELYLTSFQCNMITEEIILQLRKNILANLLKMKPDEVSRSAWLFTVAGGEEAKVGWKLLHSRLATIIDGGLQEYTLKDVSVIVWALGIWNQPKTEALVQKVQHYVQEELQRQKAKKSSQELVGECSWVLWAYLNNYPLSLKTIDQITNIILTIIPKSPLQTPIISVFDLVNITNFYHSLQLPSQMHATDKAIKDFCFEEFKLQYQTMQCDEVCKMIKCMGGKIWAEEKMSNDIIDMFLIRVDKLNLRDLLTVLGLVLPLKRPKVQQLVVKIMERKKILQSLTEFQK